MKKTVHSFFILVLMIPGVQKWGSAQPTEEPRHRLIVLTDIEADPDDSQSLVRLLLYSNVIDIEGIIATTSTHQREKVAPESVHEIIDAYGKVQPRSLSDLA
jgi:hypothetical protein